MKSKFKNFLHLEDDEIPKEEIRLEKSIALPSLELRRAVSVLSLGKDGLIAFMLRLTALCQPEVEL